MVVATRQQRQQRQLVQPTSHIPWSVDVVHLVPRRLKDLASRALAGCCGAGWAAFTTGDGYVYAWPTVSKSLSEPLEASTQFVKLFLPDLVVENDGDNNDVKSPDIYLALSKAQQGVADAQAAHLYAYHCGNAGGWLCLRKLSHKDLMPSRAHLAVSHNAKTRLDLLSSTKNTEQEREKVTSVTASPGLLVLATNLGNIFWVTATSVPVGLHVQRVHPQSGFFSRLVFGSESSASSTGVDSSSHILPLKEPEEFLSLSARGDPYALIRWKVSVTAGTAHHATFKAASKVILDLSQILANSGTILRAALAMDNQSLHCVVLGKVDGIEKLFWVQSSLDGAIQRSEWINRFAEPSQVEVLGMVTMENESAYAVFSQPHSSAPISGGVIVMALLPDEDTIQEMELPPQTVPSLLPEMMERDTTTHGCSLYTTTGLGLRVRYLPRDDPPFAKKARHSSSSSAGLSNTALVSHLRSAFWQAYQDPTTQRLLPPSLPAASPDALEAAVVSLATELQHKVAGGRGSDDADFSFNPIEWHRALIKFLQERGLYRRLSTTGKWQLLSMGQELAAFGYVTTQQHSFGLSLHRMGDDDQDECHSYNLAGWLQKVQDPQSSQWNTLLAGLLEAAMLYREENATAFYDVLHKPTIPLWWSQESMQEVLKKQLTAWQNRSVPRNLAEPVATAALFSFLEYHPDKRLYQQIQRLAIDLLRSLDSDETEELAFDLCIKCNYFEGLCQMSVDHEKRRDAAAFSLDPLFETIKSKDVVTGYTFPQYVLQWHTDNELFGHAINYGRVAPNELDLLMKHDEQLRKYKWIPAVQQGYFERATESCLQNAEDTSTISLKDQQFAFSMAKLSHLLCVAPNQNRQRLIDGKLDLVKAQQMLEEEEENAQRSTASINPKTSEALVHTALRKLATAISFEDRVRYATIALAVCNAMEDTATSIDYTAQVWAETLQVDEPLWTNCIQTEHDLTNPALKDRMMERTVFGALLEECRRAENSSMTKVMYGRHIESSVLEKLGTGTVNPLELSRFLRLLTVNPDAMQGQSLIAAAY